MPRVFTISLAEDADLPKDADGNAEPLAGPILFAEGDVDLSSNSEVTTDSVTLADNARLHPWLEVTEEYVDDEGYTEDQVDLAASDDEPVSSQPASDTVSEAPGSESVSFERNEDNEETNF
jgi:hypothetical protein